MENIRELRRRIKSVASTEQMVRAMRMVSVSKLRRTQDALQCAREYLDCCLTLMNTVRASAPAAVPPLMRQSRGGLPCIVLLTGNRGLCGTYNQEIVEFFRQEQKSQEIELVICGRWGADNLDISSLPVKKIFRLIEDAPTAESCLELSSYLVGGFLDGRFSSVEIIHQEFVNVIARRPSRSVFLPMAGNEKSNQMGELLFEPDAPTVLESLSDKYVRAYLYAVILSAKVAEHSARMTAMSSASDNAGEMKERLTHTLNKARQSAVTTEMLELMGGAAREEP